ncbi:MAG TPA: hypothetical protein VGJ88_01140 [Thermoanaerobaculia bacterium]
MVLLTSLMLATLATAAPVTTADEVIERYAAARGGIERMHGIRTVIYRGEYREGEHVSSDAALSLMRPYYKLVGDAEHRDPDFAEGYDGSAWEFYREPGIVVRTVGAASEAGRHAVSIDGPLIGYRERGWEVALAGKERIDGRDAWHLVITMPDGFRQDEFVDAETWLLIAERKAAPVHAFGNKVASEERIGDYREVAGVLFPFAHKEVELSTGRVLNEMQWKAIVVNHELDAAIFSPPEWTRTPIQLLMAQLFAERPDVNAVTWTYRDFRAAHPEADSDAAMQAVGYQILKMGDVASAVALLKENATAYPRSSRAAFGLGRALGSAGECPSASRELQRALALDGTFKRAADALEALPCAPAH